MCAFLYVFDDSVLTILNFFVLSVMNSYIKNDH